MSWLLGKYVFLPFFVVVAKWRKSSYLFRKHKSHDINIPKYHMDLYISIRSFAGINSIEKFKSDIMILITLLLFCFSRTDLFYMISFKYKCGWRHFFRENFVFLGKCLLRSECRCRRYIAASGRHNIPLFSPPIPLSLLYFLILVDMFA